MSGKQLEVFVVSQKVVGKTYADVVRELASSGESEITVDPTWVRFKDCRTRNEWRRRKAAEQRGRCRLHELEEELRAEAFHHQHEQLKRLDAGHEISNWLWGGGKSSKTNPFGRTGLFTWIFWFLVVVPIMGILYKLGFTWVGVVAVVLCALIAHLQKRH
jgi:hypothetical protein